MVSCTTPTLSSLKVLYHSMFSLSHCLRPGVDNSMELFQIQVYNDHLQARIIHEARLPTAQSQTTLCHSPTHRRTKQRIMGCCHWQLQFYTSIRLPRPTSILDIVKTTKVLRTCRQFYGDSDTLSGSVATTTRRPILSQRQVKSL
jgi:hypothetical protein